MINSIRHLIKKLKTEKIKGKLEICWVTPDGSFSCNKSLKEVCDSWGELYAPGTIRRSKIIKACSKSAPLLCIKQKGGSECFRIFGGK